MSLRLAYVFYWRHSREKEKGKGKRNPLEKRWGYRVVYDVNRLGTSKVVTYIPILLGHYGKLRFVDDLSAMAFFINKKIPS